MVAKIKSGKSLIGAINYNENKVKQGKAELINAVGYIKDPANLRFFDKLFRLTDLAERNERTKTNTVHLSLNFANGEDLPDDKLNTIAVEYMNGIGFENQPYLVYRHFDAGHPHVHIVTTNIKSDGYRISLHYLGQNESEKARKAIEIKYGLVKAEEQQKQKPELKSQISAAEYGKAETKRTITNILSYALRAYKFTSIPELNAVLQGYNIQAVRGSKGSRMFAHQGLVYWITDKQGNKTGVPVKASTIYGDPTLKTLEEKFRLSETLRKPFREKLKGQITRALQDSKDLRSFQLALKAENIGVIFRRNESGRIYGVTFIDHQSKTVFNGSDLGKEFSANPMNERFDRQEKGSVCKNPGHPESDAIDLGEVPDLLQILLQPDHNDTGALNKIKRESRKKRKGLNL